MNCRMRNTACAFASVGRIRPQYVSSPPACAMRMNVGMSVTWYGTMTIARNDQNIASRPGNFFFANA